jgi:hypothetical protein
MYIDAIRCLEDWKKLSWKCAGLGSMSARLPRHTDMRVHIWNRGLLREDAAESGAMQAQRSDLQTRVLYGSLTNTSLVLEPSSRGKHYLWQEQLREPELKRIYRVLLDMTDEEWYLQGDSYRMPAGTFHWSRLDEGDPEMSITVVRAHSENWTITPSCVCPKGKEPCPYLGTSTPTMKVLMRSLQHDASKQLHQLINLPGGTTKRAKSRVV